MKIISVVAYAAIISPANSPRVQVRQYERPTMDVCQTEVKAIRKNVKAGQVRAFCFKTK